MRVLLIGGSIDALSELLVTLTLDTNTGGDSPQENGRMETICRRFGVSESSITEVQLLQLHQNNRRGDAPATDYCLGWPEK